jgi:hypothetical protein
MQLLIVNLNVKMYWGIFENDPKSFPLDCMPGWSLVNPLLYNSIQQQLNSPGIDPGTKPTFVVGDRFHVLTKGFLLVNSESNSEFEQPSFSFEWFDTLIRLVEYFRYASKQFSLLPEVKSFGPKELTELPDLVFPSKGDGCATQAWHINTALTRDDVKVAGRCALTSPPPAYDTMLLDAMDAVLRQDYRTSVLLSAMSIENLARLKLEKAAKIIPSDITLKQLQNAKLNELLHKLPLQLLDKSLFQDNQNLYKKVLDIYRKRNTIIHAGAFHDKTDYSIIRLARDAIQSAIQVVEWFGELGGYSSPLNKEKGGIFCNEAYYPDSSA